MARKRALGQAVGATMQRSTGDASEAGDVEVRFARAPVDRLFVGCVIALLLVYGGWLLVLRLWLDEPQPEARQGFHGFVSGSSQPPAGGGESSPTAAGEFGSSKRGLSRYFGGATPRPIAEGARVVASEEPPATEPARERAPISRPAAKRSPESSSAGTEEPAIGRLRIGKVLARLLVRKGSSSVDVLVNPIAAQPE
jgi:hypothetical protein